MHVSTLFSAAAAFLVGVAQAQIDIAFYDSNWCRGPGGVNVSFTQDNTLTFGQRIYRAVGVFKPEGSTCEYTLTPDGSTAKSIDTPISPEMPRGYRCVITSNDMYQSLAIESVRVFNCTGDGHAPS